MNGIHEVTGSIPVWSTTSSHSFVGGGPSVTPRSSHNSGVAEGSTRSPKSYYGVNTWIITVRIPASALPPGDRISNSTVTEWEPGLRPVLRYAVVVRVATGRLIPPSTSNPVDGNGLPSDLTWILTMFPDVTSKNWLETSTRTEQV